MSNSISHIGTARAAVERAPIAVGGENLIDYVNREGVATAYPGGSPYNVAMALGRLGANVTYISPISDDHWGDMLAETLIDFERYPFRRTATGTDNDGTGDDKRRHSII